MRFGRLFTRRLSTLNDAIPKMQGAINETPLTKHDIQVRFYQEKLKKMPRSELLSLVGHLRTGFENPVICSLTNKAKLEAAQRILNPNFHTVYHLEGGPFVAEAMVVAKKNGYHCVLLCLPTGKTSCLASLADRVLEIENLSDVPTIMKVIENDKRAHGIKRIALNPGHGEFSEKLALAEACEVRGFHFIGPNTKMLAIINDERAFQKMAAECGVPLIPEDFDISKAKSHIEVQIVPPRKVPKWEALGEAVILSIQDCFLSTRTCDRSKLFFYAKRIGEKITNEGCTQVATLEFLEKNGEFYILNIKYGAEIKHLFAASLQHPLNVITLDLWLSSGRPLEGYLQNCLEKSGIFCGNKSPQEMVDAVHKSLAPPKQAFFRTVSKVQPRQLDIDLVPQALGSALSSRT